MTTYVGARDALANHISTSLSTDYPTLKVFWENATKADPNTVGTSFLQVEIQFNDATDITIDPAAQIDGTVLFRLFYKEGQGTRQALGLFDYLSGKMAFTENLNASGVTLTTPYPGRKRSKDGWASFDLVAPFFFRTI